MIHNLNIMDGWVDFFFLEAAFFVVLVTFPFLLFLLFFWLVCIPFLKLGGALFLQGFPSGILKNLVL